MWMKMARWPDLHFLGGTPSLSITKTCTSCIQNYPESSWIIQIPARQSCVHTPTTKRCCDQVPEKDKHGSYHLIPLSSPPSGSQAPAYFWLSSLSWPALSSCWTALQLAMPTDKAQPRTKSAVEKAMQMIFTDTFDIIWHQLTSIDIHWHRLTSTDTHIWWICWIGLLLLLPGLPVPERDTQKAVLDFHAAMLKNLDWRIQYQHHAFMTIGPSWSYHWSLQTLWQVWWHVGWVRSVPVATLGSLEVMPASGICLWEPMPELLLIQIDYCWMPLPHSATAYHIYMHAAYHINIIYNSICQGANCRASPARLASGTFGSQDSWASCCVKWLAKLLQHCTSWRDSATCYLQEKTWRGAKKRRPRFVRVWH